MAGPGDGKRFIVEWSKVFLGSGKKNSFLTLYDEVISSRHISYYSGQEVFFWKNNTFIVDYTLVSRETCYLVLRQVQRNYFQIRQTTVSLHLP